MAIGRHAAGLSPSDADFRAALLRRVSRDANVLVDRKHSAGGWAPILDTQEVTNLRTYSTVMSLWALLECRQIPGLSGPPLDIHIDDAVKWLLAQYETHKMWVPKCPVKTKSSNSQGSTVRHDHAVPRGGSIPLLPGYSVVQGGKETVFARPPCKTTTHLSEPAHARQRYETQWHRLLRRTEHISLVSMDLRHPEANREGSSLPRTSGPRLNPRASIWVCAPA